MGKHAAQDAGGPVAAWTPPADDGDGATATGSDSCGGPPVAVLAVPAGTPLAGTVHGGTAWQPDRPSFSPDGRFWWDGTRWQELTPQATSGTRVGRGRGLPAGVVVAVAAVAAVLVGALVLLVVSLPTFVAQRGDTLDRAARTALHEARVAQETFLVENGRYAGDVAELASAGVDLDAPVGVEVLAAGTDAYCLGGALPGEEAAWFLTETGEVTTVPCA
nr:hypothetical protein [uncultured Actinotalea sp.]